MNESSLQKIVLASSNPGKAHEIQAVLAEMPIALISQTEFNVPDAEETGLTFIENAIIKARHAAELTGLPALADDSGIAVDYLDGAPGIYSARYAGPNADMHANTAKLLRVLANVPEEQRDAQFICVTVLLKHAADPTPLICQGRWHGRIMFKHAGTNGFGYDPIFYVPSHACSAAQLTSDVKNKISHRGQALQQLKNALRKQLHRG